jgi:hypothetical protein
MSTKISAGRTRSTYEFIKANRHMFSVQVMCRLLGVAPSGYYAWLKQPVSSRAQEDARLLRLIRASFTAGQGIYGAPRVFLDLREAGETCSKHRVARLMRENHLRATARLSHSGLVCRQALRGSTQPPTAAVHGDSAEQGVGHGYHLHSDVAGVALLGGRDGPVLSQDRRLGSETDPAL